MPPRLRKYCSMMNCWIGNCWKMNWIDKMRNCSKKIHGCCSMTMNFGNWMNWNKMMMTGKNLKNSGCCLRNCCWKEQAYK